MDVSHPQLRSLISSPCPDIFYYACNSDLFRLNISTCKQEIIASLPFSARCLVAGYGWLCAGAADNGQFAAVSIDDDHSVWDGSSSSRYADVDHMISLQLPSNVQRDARHPLPLAEGRPGSAESRKPTVRIHELGGNITNSITLYQAPEGGLNADDGPVAVLS